MLADGYCIDMHDPVWAHGSNMRPFEQKLNVYGDLQLNFSVGEYDQNLLLVT